jgi:serine acetyltransferase
VVIADVPANSIAVGIPARIKPRRKPADAAATELSASEPANETGSANEVLV